MDYFEEYFNQSFEKTINEKSLYRAYVFPVEEIHEYIDGLLNISIEDIISRLSKKELEPLTPADVFQFSSFSQATNEICKCIYSVNNPGLKDIEIGKLLLNDGKCRKDSAYRKYGENHAKLATKLTLLFCLANTYYLSGIGYTFPNLSEDTQKRLLTRLVLRDKLIGNLVNIASSGTIDLKGYLLFLSESTYVRRRSNVKTVLSVLNESDEYDFSYITDRIIIR